jgi:hypothetical protein
MDRFQAVLQLALDEAEANKKRYRDALKTIDDRNQQVAANFLSLKAAQFLMKENNQNMSLLSKKLEQALARDEDTS